MAREGMHDELGALLSQNVTDAEAIAQTDFKYSPEYMNRFRKVGKLGISGLTMAVPMGLQAAFKKLGLDKDQATELTGSVIQGAPTVVDTVGTTIAAAGSKAKAIAAARGIAKTLAVDAPVGAGAFVLADKAYEGVDDALSNLGVNSDNRMVLASAASGGVFQVGLDATKAGVSAAGKGASAAIKGLSGATKAGEEGIELAATRGGAMVGGGPCLICHL